MTTRTACSASLVAYKHAPEWEIEAELRKPGKKSRVHAAEFSQPLCTAIQIALDEC